MIATLNPRETALKVASGIGSEDWSDVVRDMKQRVRSFLSANKKYLKEKERADGNDMEGYEAPRLQLRKGLWITAEEADETDAGILVMVSRWDHCVLAC